MRSGIDIPSCQFDRNRATISGNQVLCASPEGIFLSSPPQPCTLTLPLSFYSRELAPVNTELGLAELCASRRCEYWTPHSTRPTSSSAWCCPRLGRNP